MLPTRGRNMDGLQYPGGIRRTIVDDIRKAPTARKYPFSIQKRANFLDLATDGTRVLLIHQQKLDKILDAATPPALHTFAA